MSLTKEQQAKDVTIYLLKCEDLSSTGGPMGSDRVYHLWTKPFASLVKAKEFAASKAREDQAAKPDWSYSSGRWYWDAMSLGFEIRKQVVK